MNITRFSIRRPVGISMIVAFFVVLGLYSYYRIGVELLPSINIPYVTVSVNYPGAGAESVEQQVVKPLENALSSVSNLKHMTSVASPEQARITLELDMSANADYASIEATKKVNAVRRQLPDGIDEPVVIKRDADATPIMEIAITAPYPLADIYSEAENTFQQRLEQSGGVSDVMLYGGRDKEIAINVDKDRLAFYNMTLSQIISQVKGENVLLPSGSVYTDRMQTDVRVTAQYQDPAEIDKLQIKNSGGVSIPITDVATVKAQDARVSRYGRVNGQDTISLEIYKNSDANIVATADGVLAQLDKLRAEYPDYTFTVVTNSADYVRDSLNNTLEALIEGLCTTGLVLFLFLRGWRSTAAVMVAIPTSLVATFFMMYIAGFTFNMMSLMGMALCIGILVDDSIVVLENIHRHLAMGKPAAQAAEEGRTEIGMAAIAITLCDVVVFMPIAFMTGMTGQFFRQFGLTIVFAALFSMFVSFTLTPMLASKLFQNGPAHPRGRVWAFMDRLEEAAVAKYEKIARWSLAHPKKILIPALIGFLLAVSLVPTGVIGAEYMPKTDESAFQIHIELPVGQNVDQTNAAVAYMEEYVKTIPEATNYLSRASANQGRISVQLVDRKLRGRTVWQITDAVRDFARRNVSTFIVRVNETQASVAGVSGGGGGGGALRLELRGADMKALVAASYQVQEILGGVRGLKDIKSSYNEGMPELRLTIDREKLKFYHTSIGDITASFAAAIAGQKAGVYANDPANNGQDTDIEVRLKDSDGFKASDIRKIPISAGGHTIFLGDVAKIEDGVGPVSIRRVDKMRSVNIQANVDGPLSDAVQQVTAKLDAADLHGVKFRFTGQADSMDQTFGEMISALALSLVLVYMLLAVLYESTLTPFIRMFSLPLGLIGSLLFLLLTHNTINLYSLIGILVMDGVVAKNGTLLLDYALTLMERGHTAYDAIIESGKTRLKPIFMTTLTMVVGMMPTALAVSEGSETRVSMAWVIIGGLLSSTVFTLVVIPIIFLFFENHPVRTWAGGVKRWFGRRSDLAGR